MTATATKVKQCTGCRRQYPATTEFFTRHKGGLGGLNGRCKECVKKQALARQMGGHVNDDIEQVWALVLEVCRVHREERDMLAAAGRRSRWEAMHA